MKFLPFAWILAAGVCMAAEPPQLPLEIGALKAGGKSYDGVKIVAVDAVGVKIMHEAGTARIPYERLPPEIAARFPRDEAAAQAQRDKEAAELAAHDKEMDLAEKPAAPTPNPSATTGSDDADEPEIPEEQEPQLDGKSVAERIAVLRGYALRLKGEVAALERSAQRAAERNARKANDQRYKDLRLKRDKDGRLVDATTEAGKRRVQNIHDKTREIQERVLAVHVKIGRIENEIQRLQGSVE